MTRMSSQQLLPLKKVNESFAMTHMKVFITPMVSAHLTTFVPLNWEVTVFLLLFWFRVILVHPVVLFMRISALTVGQSDTNGRMVKRTHLIRQEALMLSHVIWAYRRTWTIKLIHIIALAHPDNDKVLSPLLGTVGSFPNEIRLVDTNVNAILVTISPTTVDYGVLTCWTSMNAMLATVLMMPTDV